MNVALTGASGFIGSFAARHLHTAGHRVTALVRPTSRRDHIQPFVERFVVGNHDDESLWPDLLRDTECVIHNSIDWAAEHEWNIDQHLQSNLVGSIKLLEACAPRQFVYISSIAVHHDMRPRWKGVIDEDHPLRPKNHYGALKAAVEAHLWAAFYERGQHTCAIRPCAVYGIDPELIRSHGYALVEKLVRGEPVNKPGGGKFVHIDDVAAAIVATVGNPNAAGKPYNMVDCYARWADWAKMASNELGGNVPIDFSSPTVAKNVFTKDAVQSLGVKLDRGHDGIRAHLRQLIAAMQQPMHWTAFLAYRRFPAHARVMEDCACIQCGYNLRTQMVSSRCPECGHEVGNSVFLLAKPSIAARGLRTAAVTYLAPFAVIVSLVSSAFWALFVVSLVAAVGALFRFIGVSDLHFNAAIARLPVVGSRLKFWWAVALIDLIVAGAWLIGMVVVSGSRILQNNGVGATVVTGGSIAWWVSMLLSAWAAGHFGLALMDMLNYVWTRIEFRVQQYSTAIVFLLTPFVMISIKTATTYTLQAILAGGLIIITLLVMLATALPLLHSATACEESAETWDDLLDSDRIAMVPEASLPRKPEPPAIKVEGG